MALGRFEAGPHQAHFRSTNSLSLGIIPQIASWKQLDRHRAPLSPPSKSRSRRALNKKMLQIAPKWHVLRPNGSFFAPSAFRDLGFCVPQRCASRIAKKKHATLARFGAQGSDEARKAPEARGRQPSKQSGGSRRRRKQNSGIRKSASPRRDRKSPSPMNKNAGIPRRRHR